MSDFTAQDAQNRLRELLKAAGHADPQAVSVADFWPVWKTFAREDFGFACADDADGLLFEYFVPSGTLKNRLPSVQFVRQFTYNDAAGVYERMEQLRCEFSFAAPLDDPDVASVVLWSFELSLSDYFAQVESLPVFQAALAAPPVRVAWEAGEV